MTNEQVLFFYSPWDHYWIVAGDTTRVYSSKSANYVQITDQTYKAWLANGRMPTSIDTEINLSDVLAPYGIVGPIVVVPKEVSALQGRLAINSVPGLRAQVEAAITNSGQDTKDFWEYATIWYRDNPLLNQMATAVSLTSQQIDNLFIQAKNL